MRKPAVLLPILLLLVSAVVLAGCGGGGGGSETPEKAAKAFFAAFEDGDAGTVWSMLAENTKKQAGSNDEADLKELLDELGSVEFTVGKVTVNGDKATAEVTVAVSGETSTETVPLVKEKGVWKVEMASMGK